MANRPRPHVVPTHGLQVVTGVRAVSWGMLDHSEAMTRMEQARRACIAGDEPDTIFYLEHEPVITYGRGTPPEHIDLGGLGIPVVQVARGGQATYHGPGQLVGYAVVDLSKRAGGHRPDVHEYLRAMEEGIARYLNQSFGFPAVGVEGYTGVWVDPPGAEPRKIASIGVSVRRWVTGHGFALNVAPNLSVFESFVPCGLEGVTMTSIQRELESVGRAGAVPPMADVARGVHVEICAALARRGWCGGRIAGGEWGAS